MEKNPFIITYTKEVDNKSDSEILNDFKVNFERSNCDKLYILSKKKILVENSIFRFTVNWNKWNGISKAELTIIDLEDQTKKIIEYKVDFTRGVIGYIFSLILLSLFVTVFLVKPLILAVGFVLLIILFVGLYVFIVLPRYNVQKNLFNKTIDKGIESENVGKYNWAKILEKKTEKELFEISCGMTHLPKTIEKMALYELDKK